MKRRNLIKGLGAIGLGSVIPLKAVSSFAKSEEEILQAKRMEITTCWLTPALTEGPYYFNANLVRSDIRTNTSNNAFHTGVPLTMKFNVVNLDCNPIPNVLVDIWHCDKDGLYSGYVQPGGNTTGQNFMRGIQITDTNGQCSFITSYPGWYNGRATHVHFKVRLSSTTYVTSQYCFADGMNARIYATPLYVSRGNNPTTNQNDSIFHSPNPQYLLMKVSEDIGGAPGTYAGTYTIGVNVTTKDIKDNKTNESDFSLNANYPNPFNPSTKISYYLPVDSYVSLIVYDVSGKEVAHLVEGMQTSGLKEVIFDGTNLSSGYYFCRLKAGDFSATREMLLYK